MFEMDVESSLLFHEPLDTQGLENIRFDLFYITPREELG